MFDVRATVLVCSVGYLLTGCAGPSTSTVGEGARCQVNADCEAGLYCGGGICRRAPTETVRDGGSDAMEDAAPPPEEPCNGRDDDGDGVVDEGCTCTPGTTQPCYPAPYPPEGCTEGSQQCTTGGSWGPCEGYEQPGEGRSKCCLALDGADEPLFEQLDKCMAAWPSDAIPGCHGVVGWMPTHPDCTFTRSNASTGGEFVDRGAGGIALANVEAGRMAARQNAMMDFGVAAEDIVAERVPDIIVVGEPNCYPGGRAHAWGAFLYKKDDGSVGEVVYLYVGNCQNGCDDEAFLRLAEPVQACAPGTIPI